MRGFSSPRVSRGTWQGRGRGRGKFAGSKPSGTFYHKDEATPAQLMEGLGDEIDTIPVPSSTSGHSDPVSIQNFQEVASYSWLDSKDPTIIVPGSPPIWTERPMPYAVPRDSGTVFVDQNAKRLSTSPLLPLIVAVAQHAPSFPLSSVEFVTDRNGLRKLWRWATGSNSGNFRIDVELVGKQTILMERWEPATTQQGGPGYEHEFEKASTKPAKGCENGSGHHRIVTYDLGGMKMLVRFKTDATLTGQEDSEEDVTEDPLDNLASKLGSLSVVTPPDTTDVRIPTFGGAFLKVVSGGVLVPQSSIVELKTRSIKYVHTFDWDDAYPQLLLSQTPHIFVCMHERGDFQQVRKRTLEELGAEEMARKAYESLRILRKALSVVRDIARGEGEGVKLSLVCTGGDILVYETKGGERCLPPTILKKFE